MIEKEKIAAFLDMGTNSLRIMIARINPDRTFTVLRRQKEMIRLGEGEFGDNRLQEDAIQRAVTVCRNFADMAHSFDAEKIIAVATSATRDAKNQKAFINKLKIEAGLDVRVISGNEEARLIYLGVSSGIDFKGRALFIDIGGGSTELIVGDKANYDYLDSLKLGAIRLTMLDYFDTSRPVTSRQYKSLQEYIKSTAIRSVQRIKKLKPDKAFGSSGTIQNLSEIACQVFYKGNPEKRQSLRLKDLRRSAALLCSLPLKDRSNIPGINPRRADIIIAGAAVLETMMSEIGIDKIMISSRELRDGLLVDYLNRLEESPVGVISVRQESVLRLCRRCRFDEKHANTVARLALELFDSAKAIGLNRQGKGKRELLYYAALMHDIGTFLSFANHHSSGYFFILHSDLLGFNQDELAIMAAAVFFHRKVFPNIRYQEYAKLDEKARETVRTLSILLRIAESLDKSHSSCIQNAAFKPSGKDAVVLDIKSSRGCQLELWGVQNHLEAFRKTFGKSCCSSQKE